MAAVLCDAQFNTITMLTDAAGISIDEGIVARQHRDSLPLSGYTLVRAKRLQE